MKLAFNLYLKGQTDKEVEEQTGINRRTFQRYRERYNIHREKNKRNLLGWLIFFLIIVLIAISSLLIINIMRKQSVNKVKSYEKEYSVQDNTQDSSSPTKRSNYGVNFNGISESSGNHGTLKFNLSNTKTDEIRLSYDSPNFSEQQIAFLTPKKIETKILKVNANSEVKEVNTNTELKLANVSNSVTKEFF